MKCHNGRCGNDAEVIVVYLSTPIQSIAVCYAHLTDAKVLFLTLPEAAKVDSVVPSEPGHYWASKIGSSHRRVLVLLDEDGDVLEMGDGALRAAKDYINWSEKIETPEGD